MNTDAVIQIMRPLAGPVLWSLAVTLIAWRLLDWRGPDNAPPSRRSGPAWSGAVALGGGMLLGALIDLGPSGALRWGEPRALPTHAALLAMVFVLVEQLWSRAAPAALIWSLRAIAAGGLLALVLARYAEPSGLARAGIIAGWALGVVGAWWAAERPSRARGAASIAPTLMTAALATPLLMTVSLSPGKGAMWLAGAIGAALVAALVLRRRGVSLAGPGLGVFWLALGSMLVIRVHVAEDIPLWMAACVGISPVAALAADAPLPARAHPAASLAVRLVLAALPIGAALAVAIPKAMRDAGGAF